MPRWDAQRRYGAYTGAALIGAGLSPYPYAYSKYKKRNPKRTVRRRSKQYNRNKKYYRKPKTKSLKAKVQKLEHKVNADLAKHTFKKSISFTKDCSYSVAATSSTHGYWMGELEGALASLRYYDPGTNALVTNSGVSGSFSNTIYIASVWTKCIMRNNYKVPVDITCYVVVPKKDTSINPETAYQQGLLDQKGPSNTSTLMYPTDSEQFNDLYTIKKKVHKILEPGKQCSISYSVGGFYYDPADYDAHALNYQKKYGSHLYLFRLQGVMSHDSVVTNEIGLCQSQVDCAVERKTVIQYDAGKKLNDFTLDDNYDAFTNQPETGIYQSGQNENWSLT